MIGVGGVGHIALQLVRELGSSSVIAVDTDDRRRRLAAELGAGHVSRRRAVDAVHDLTGGRGADLVFDFVGTDQTHGAAAAMLARGGAFSVIGYGGTIAIPSAALVVNEHAVVGNLVGTWIDLWELLQLHAAGPGRPRDRDAPPGCRERRARQAPRRRGHRPRRADSGLEGSAEISRKRASCCARSRSDSHPPCPPLQLPVIGGVRRPFRGPHRTRNHLAPVVDRDRFALVAAERAEVVHPSVRSQERVTGGVGIRPPSWSHSSRRSDRRR